MRDVTPEEVKIAVDSAGITRIDHHDCGLCGSLVFYSVHDGNLFFNSACDCTPYRSPPRPRAWSDASDWINMQSDDKWRATLAARFGLSLQEEVPVP